MNNLSFNQKKALIHMVNSKNKEVFDEISKYKSIFNEDLMVIYNLLNLVFCKELSNEILSKKYNNGMCYSIIASRHRINKRYFESLFFAYKAKEMFIMENNLKNSLKSQGFTLKKKYGQNFLSDENLLNEIVDLSGIDKNTTVLEIGPGAGALTRVLSEKAKKVLGWNPTHDSLEEIISSAWNWHKNHPNGYND